MVNTRDVGVVVSDLERSINFYSCGDGANRYVALMLDFLPNLFGQFFDFRGTQYPVVDNKIVIAANRG